MLPGPIDPETRTGSYAMRLFPEVRPDRGFDFGGDGGPDNSTPGPETTYGAVPAHGNDSFCVNSGRLGSHNRPENPRLGLEPRTCELTARRSTNVLSGN